MTDKDLAYLAERAIELVEADQDIKLTAHDLYFIGQKIMNQSGAYFEVPSKMNEE